MIAADVGGVYDAFSIDPVTRRSLRLTRLEGGVSFPAFHPDGSLLFTYFEGRGRDLYRIRTQGKEEPAFDQEERRAWYLQFSRTVPQGEVAEKTRVWGFNSLMFPVTGGPLVLPGLEFSLGDLDAENNLAIAARGVSPRIWSVSAAAANTRYWPTLAMTAEAGRMGELHEAVAGPSVELTFWSLLTVGVGWIGRYRSEVEVEGREPHYFDSGPSVSFLFLNQHSYQPRDPAWGLSVGGTAACYCEDFGGQRNLTDVFAFVEASTDLTQDWILWCRVTFEKLIGRALLEDEPFKLREILRGARSLQGVERGVASLELRFPIYRDLLVEPLEAIGLGPWLILKDFRGFAFGQTGYAGSGFPEDRETRSVWNVGIGLRIDFSFMLWPAVTARVPTRIEVWWACVSQENEPIRGAMGVGFQIGF